MDLPIAHASAVLLGAGGLQLGEGISLEKKLYGGGVHRNAWKRRTPTGGNVFWKSGRELIDGHTHVRYWRASGQRSPGLSFSYAHHNVFPAR